MSARDRSRAEWLEADGLGGFASGMVTGPRTRRYHALLAVSRQPPVDRSVLVNGIEAWLERDGERVAITAQRYAPGIVHPPDAATVLDFTTDPWPTWRLRLADGTVLEHEVTVPRDRPAVILRWRLLDGRPGRLVARPLLSARDLHALHHENPDFRFEAEVRGELVRWHPYAGLPAILSLADAAYRHEPQWYRRFELAEEAARGFDAVEDLASPGTFTWSLGDGHATMLLAADGVPRTPLLPTAGAGAFTAPLLAAEARRRAALGGPLERAADAYVVRRGQGRSLIAGYPWFTDWGRDTFIALNGLTLATGRLDVARELLLAWAGEVSEGMLPNRFIDHGGEPEYNAVDASLWYVVAVHEWRRAMRRGGREVAPADAAALEGAVQAILDGYARGTRFGIAADEDGLLRAGVAGVQLTWMDAKVGDWVVTPRVGKPVEVQALWVNALRIGGRRWSALRHRAEASFAERFWNPATGGLFDVVDVDHVRGTADATIRPNQLLAVGRLPWPLLDGERARSVVAVVERELWTPLGPRSLAPAEPGYRPHYRGGPVERDGAYHMGTVWPWLAGAFVEAWVRANGGGAAARRAARARFLDPLLAHLDDAGIGHVSEIADADAPHVPGGCPFQAWSVAEVLRLDRAVLGARPRRAVPA